MATAAVVIEDKEDQLRRKYDQATLVQDWLRMIHEQVVLIKSGISRGEHKKTIIGGVDVLQLILMDFWDSSARDVEKVTQELKDNGFGRYVGEA